MSAHELMRWCLQRLSAIKEKNGDIQGACTTLNEIQVETYGSMERREKVSTHPIIHRWSQHSETSRGETHPVRERASHCAILPSLCVVGCRPNLYWSRCACFWTTMTSFARIWFCPAHFFLHVHLCVVLPTQHVSRPESWGH